jgi:hypothetical protein
VSKLRKTSRAGPFNICFRLRSNVMALAVYRKEDLDLRIKRCLVARHELCRASNEATLRAFRNADRFPTFKIFRRPGALRRRVAPGQSRAALVSAGQTIDQRFPNADQSGDWNDGAGAPVEVTGIGFFDRPHNQTGRAPNNIEIHPILSIQFLSQPTPATSPTPIPTAQPSPTGEPMLFGFAHYYKGPAGVLDSTYCALVLGCAYLFSGRNLWTPILAHGISDTFAVLVLFMGWAN